MLPWCCLVEISKTVSLTVKIDINGLKECKNVYVFKVYNVCGVKIVGMGALFRKDF